MSSAQAKQVDQRKAKRALRRWAFDLSVARDDAAGGQLVKDAKAPQGLLVGASAAEIENAGAPSVNLKKVQKKKIAQAWAITSKPVQNILMQGFMMYMSGSTINIFSIMITGMAFVNPVRAILGMSDTFARLEDGQLDVTVQKLAFIGVQLFGIMLAMWKCGTMGLLPVTSADWAFYIDIRRHLEETGIGGPIAL